MWLLMDCARAFGRHLWKGLADMYFCIMDDDFNNDNQQHYVFLDALTQKDAIAEAERIIMKAKHGDEFPDRTQRVDFYLKRVSVLEVTEETIVDVKKTLSKADEILNDKKKAKAESEERALYQKLHVKYGGTEIKPQPWMCDHANEVPADCICGPTCYCRQHTCQYRTGK